VPQKRDDNKDDAKKDISNLIKIIEPEDNQLKPKTTKNQNDDKSKKMKNKDRYRSKSRDACNQDQQIIIRDIDKLIKVEHQVQSQDVSNHRRKLNPVTTDTEKLIKIDNSSEMNSNFLKPKNNSRGHGRGKSQEARIHDRPPSPAVNKNKETANTNNNETQPKNLRPIIVDGSNVAMSYTNGKEFACKGLQLVVDYFKKRGHTHIEVYIPQFRRSTKITDCRTTNPEILDALQSEGILIYTPSKSYDDRFVITSAIARDGVIVSNDKYRDIISEKAENAQEITKRLLPYVIVKDLFMPAEDPFGKYGPKIDEFLAFGTNSKPKPPVKRKYKPVVRAIDDDFKRMVVEPVKSSLKNEEEALKITESSANRRDPYITEEIRNTLYDVFPQMNERIDKLLIQNPNEDDILFFTDLLVFFMETANK